MKKKRALKEFYSNPKKYINKIPLKIKFFFLFFFGGILLIIRFQTHSNLDLLILLIFFFISFIGLYILEKK